MTRLFRLAIAWLLLVAVPLQGYAAAGMLVCGAADERPESVARHDHHDHAANASTPHHDHAAPGVNDAGEGSDTWNPHHLTHGKCSVCSSCCSAAVLPPALIASDAESPDARAHVESEDANPGQGATRLERPPRLILA